MNIKNYHDLLKWFSELANWERKATIQLMSKYLDEENTAKGDSQ